MASVKPVPDGYRTIIPHLAIKGASEALDFYCRAFGAQEVRRSLLHDGRLMHGELRIGDSQLFVAEEFPEHGCAGPRDGNSPVTIHLYVADTDALFQQAVAAGATVTMPPTDMFWGDRYAAVVDPFGHRWSIATHIEDLTPEQMQERMNAMFSAAPGS